MTEQEFETLRDMIASEDQGLITLAIGIVEDSDLDIADMTMLHIFSANVEHKAYTWFQTDQMDKYTIPELDRRQDIYMSLCLVIGALQKKIKAYNEQVSDKRTIQDVNE